MSRLFCGKNIELLAPAGTFKDFTEIVKSSADAVYFGGKQFNMRMHRKDYNLSNDEISEAVLMAHSLGKKVYITFNNMMSNVEIEGSREYLSFLQTVKPDGFIVQDVGAVKLIREMGITIPIHSSVMMNVHNQQTIEALYKMGVSRVVTSREMSLETIKRLSKDTYMEFEYFVHGDMCIAHGSQCLYSGILFGKSSNRGLCLKPCRWPYKLGEKSQEQLKNHMAVKDMCMYEHLPELIEAGVCSFKIEGRMRNSSYLVELINAYGKAIDRYIEDPVGYYVDDEIEKLQESRTRNLSTAYAFKVPGSKNIEFDGSREPKIFSRAVEEFEVNEERLYQLKEKLKIETKAANKPLLTVKVNNMEAFKSAVDNGADEIYIPGDVFRCDRPFSKTQIKEAVEYANNKKVFIALPQMMFPRQFADYSAMMDFYKQAGIEGFIVTNIGAAAEFKNSNLKMIGEYSLNCYNTKAAEFYEDMGIHRITASIESTADALKEMLLHTKTPVEIIVQGAPTVMYLEHCVYASEHDTTSKDWCLKYCEKEFNELVDEKGFKHPVYVDQYCRNHILAAKDICFINIIDELSNLGVKAVRIEGQHYKPEVLGQVVKTYREALDNNHINEKNKLLKNITKRGQSLQALNFN